MISTRTLGMTSFQMMNGSLTFSNFSDFNFQVAKVNDQVQKAKFMQRFAVLGNSWELDELVLSGAVKFPCHLYDFWSLRSKLMWQERLR